LRRKSLTRRKRKKKPPKRQIRIVLQVLLRVRGRKRTCQVLISRKSGS
jgi:hypothetical protein